MNKAIKQYMADRPNQRAGRYCPSSPDRGNREPRQSIVFHFFVPSNNNRTNQVRRYDGSRGPNTQCASNGVRPAVEFALARDHGQPRLEIHQNLGHTEADQADTAIEHGFCGKACAHVKRSKRHSGAWGCIEEV